MFFSPTNSTDTPLLGPKPSRSSSIVFTEAESLMHAAVWPASYRESTSFMSMPGKKATKLAQKFANGIFRRSKPAGDADHEHGVPKSLDRGYYTPDIRDKSGLTPDLRDAGYKLPGSTKAGGSKDQTKDDLSTVPRLVLKRGHSAAEGMRSNRGVVVNIDQWKTPLTPGGLHVKSKDGTAAQHGRSPVSPVVPASLAVLTTKNDSDTDFPSAADEESDGEMEGLLKKGDASHGDVGAKGSSSFIQASFNAVNILMGVGMLSLPFAIRESGWMGIGILFVMACVTCYTGMLLNKCQGGFIQSYPDIGAAAFGKWGKIFIASVLYIELFFTLCLFLILEADSLLKLLPSSGFTSKQYMLAVSVALLPAAYLRDMNLLSFLSLIGIVSTCTVICSVVYYGVKVDVAHNYRPTQFYNENFPISFGLITFCFAGHAVFPNIFASMKEPERSREMLSKSYSIVCILYVLVASLGYLMYGPNTLEQITLNLPGDVGSQIISTLIIVNAYTKYALTLHPIALGLEEFVYGWKPWPKFVYIFLMRTGIVVGAFFVASSVPFFGYVASFIGAIFSMSVSAIFPILCYLKIFWSDVTRLEVAFNVLMIILSLGIAVVGTVTSIDGMAKGGSTA